MGEGKRVMDHIISFLVCSFLFLSTLTCYNTIHIIVVVVTIRNPKRSVGESEMGNCQAVDAAALVVQHPNGKQDRMYSSVSASQVMKMNPGHYVSLIIPLPDSSQDKNTVKYTRVKLLRPTDSLVLGRAYRLVTNQEVMKVVKAKRHATVVRNQSESSENASQNNNQAKSSERHTQSQRSRMTNSAAGRSKLWRPSLNSISEAGTRSSTEEGEKTHQML